VLTSKKGFDFPKKILTLEKVKDLVSCTLDIQSPQLEPSQV